MDLEPAQYSVRPPEDLRPRMAEPLPVNLEAVADMHLPWVVVDQTQMDGLYVDLLKFQRDVSRQVLAYHAENFDLIFDLPRLETHADYRPVRIIIESLAELEVSLRELEYPHVRQKGLLPGHEAIALNDPDGNYLEIREHREIG